MGRFKYTKSEQEINNVLKYHEEKLDAISFPDNDVIDERIKESESILRMLGVSLPQEKAVVNTSHELPHGVIVVPTWDELCKEAERAVGNQCALEDLFSDEEIESNALYIKSLNREYNELHRLDKYDMAISAVAGLTAALVDILMVGIPQKTPEGLKGGVLANYVRDYFDKRFPEDEMQKLANSKVSKVPYDAQDNRNTIVNVEGMSAYYHRLLSLGHDPLLGLVFGVSDIMNGSMTTIDKAGKIVTQVIPEYADRTEKDLFMALAKQIIHFKSDITTSMGLPAPLMGLFNLLQFGSIGEEEQTIAEIVQGMYYEGYDFVHFCSLSVPVMIAEVIVRIGYAIKRVKEGHAIRDSIPLSTNHEKHPKLGTMLFVGHSAATAVNAGKVYFTKNPMAINYPQWMAFGKYSYQQLKWSLIEKPEARGLYVDGIINEQLEEVLCSVNTTFDSVLEEYVVVMN